MLIDNYLKKQNELYIESLNQAFYTLNKIPNTEQIIEEISKVNNLRDLKRKYLIFLNQYNVLKNNLYFKVFVWEQLRKFLEVDLFFLYDKEDGEKAINLLNKLESEKQIFHKSIMDVIGYC